jgi:hypothetical protein
MPTFPSITQDISRYSKSMKGALARWTETYSIMPPCWSLHFACKCMSSVIDILNALDGLAGDL